MSARTPMMAIDGLGEVMDNMKELSSSVEKRIAKQAAVAAMEPVVEEARSRCPANSGHLAESIGVKNIRMRGRYRRGLIVVSVGPRKGFDWAYSGANRKNDPFKYGIPVEFGHVAPGGNFVPPVSFMRTAYSNQKEGIVDRFASELKARVEKALARVRKKALAQ